MKYGEIKKGIFKLRPNRFIAEVDIGGKEEIVHVKNTGRCREILIEGTEVILEKARGSSRKTDYSLIAAYKGDMLINIDSQVPNSVIYEAIKGNRIIGLENVRYIKREVKYDNSRFDIYFEKEGKKGFVEVKGVTLEKEGVAMFPDAPTLRGTKHLYEMSRAVEEGLSGYIIFLIQLKGVKFFTPNSIMDKEFAKALNYADKMGVKILAYDSIVSEGEIKIGNEIPVVLG